MHRFAKRSLSDIARSSLTFATMTACPISCSCWLIQMECVPASISIRTGGRSVNDLSTPARVLRKRSRSTISPSGLSVQ